MITTLDHQARSAAITFLLHEGPPGAGGAGNIERPSAACTDRLILMYLSQAGWTAIPEGTMAAAGRAEPGVPIDEGVTVNTGLLICSHDISS